MIAMRYFVVGCGLCGAVVARSLADAGIPVELWERREHIGGNLYDETDAHGILVHKYGPHVFHTNNETVWNFVSRFSEWTPYRLVCGAVWDGKYTPAFNLQTIDVFYPPARAREIKGKLLQAYAGKKKVTILELMHHSDRDIHGFAEFLFQNDYAPYSAKQWGVSIEEIDRSILRRVPFRLGYEQEQFDDLYQALPSRSYTWMFENIVARHPLIHIRLGIDATQHIKFDGTTMRIDGVREKNAVVVYTGALDELFEFRFGQLPYRSLRFEWRYDEVESLQEAPVVAYPQAPGFTRITEYKKLPHQRVHGSSYSIEYPLQYVPGSGLEPYYPLLTEEGLRLYRKYYNLAEKIQGLYVCGRLGDFRYYNMDQTVERGLQIADTLIKNMQA